MSNKKKMAYSKSIRLLSLWCRFKCIALCVAICVRAHRNVSIGASTIIKTWVNVSQQN